MSKIKLRSNLFLPMDKNGIYDTLKPLNPVIRTTSLAYLAGMGPQITIQTNDKEEARHIWEAKYKVLLETELSLISKVLPINITAISSMACQLFQARHKFSCREVMVFCIKNDNTDLSDNYHFGLSDDLMDILYSLVDKYNLLSSIPADKYILFTEVTKTLNEKNYTPTPDFDFNQSRNILVDTLLRCRNLLNTPTDDNYITATNYGAIQYTKVADILLPEPYQHGDEAIATIHTVSTQYLWDLDDLFSSSETTPTMESFEPVIKDLFADLDPVEVLALKKEREQELEIEVAMEAYHNSVAKLHTLIQLYQEISSTGLTSISLEGLQSALPGVEITSDTEYTLENISNVIKTILAYLPTQMRNIIGLIAAFIIGIVLRYIIKSISLPISEKIEKSDERLEKITKLTEALNKKHNKQPPGPSVLLQYPKTELLYNKILLTYKTRLDELILTNVAGYTQNDVIKTLSAHIITLSDITKTMGLLTSSYEKLLTFVTEKIETATTLKNLDDSAMDTLYREVDNIRTLYETDHHNYFPFSFLYLYEQITKNGGYSPNTDGNTWLPYMDRLTSNMVDDIFWDPTIVNKHNNKVSKIDKDTVVYSAGINTTVVTLIDPYILAIRSINDLSSDDKELVEGKVTILQKKAKIAVDSANKLKESASYVALAKAPAAHEGVIVWPKYKKGQTGGKSVGFTSYGLVLSLVSSEIMTSKFNALNITLTSFKDVAQVLRRIGDMRKDWLLFTLQKEKEAEQYHEACNKWHKENP